MANCDMRVEDPFPFAWCETHDETFPLGGICPETRKQRQQEAIAARARGDFDRAGRPSPQWRTEWLRLSS
jgi:hypothetical protein